ncbi:hypothetical protein FRIGORI9N_470208 [Frigoribacterium sp. 9N]|nr:hypothetical protein FRIGORI9N_470208 [Frigoribacterium sp. 9N]
MGSARRRPAGWQHLWRRRVEHPRWQRHLQRRDALLGLAVPLLVLLHSSKVETNGWKEQRRPPQAPPR